MNQITFRYIGFKEVAHLTGLSKTPLYERIKSGEFPAAVPFSNNCVRWRSDEIADWMDKQSANRDSGRNDRSVKAKAAVAKRLDRGAL